MVALEDAFAHGTVNFTEYDSRTCGEHEPNCVCVCVCVCVGEGWLRGISVENDTARDRIFELEFFLLHSNSKYFNLPASKPSN